MVTMPIEPPADGAMLGPDGRPRCPWGVGVPLLADYHDEEWGTPVHGERELFERVSLEAFQAGLSWRTILAKRPAFRTAFADFDVDAVAAFTDEQLEGLMAESGIVRNRAKIFATRNNARAVVALRDQSSLDHLIWSHRPDVSPAPRVAAQVPTTSPESEALAKTLKQAGMRFIGPTSAHALMEAIGMIDTHLVDCYRRGV